MKLIKEFFKQIKKNFQRIFKFFSYKVFLAFHGSIKGKILASKDSKIKIQQVIKDIHIKFILLKMLVYTQTGFKIPQ